MKLQCDIRKIQVIVRNGHMDQINLYVDLPTAFPELKYETVLEVRARHGYGAQWCRETFGMEPELLPG